MSRVQRSMSRVHRLESRVLRIASPVESLGRVLDLIAFRAAQFRLSFNWSRLKNSEFGVSGR